MKDLKTTLFESINKSSVETLINKAKQYIVNAADLNNISEVNNKNIKFIYDESSVNKWYAVWNGYKIDINFGELSIDQIDELINMKLIYKIDKNSEFAYKYFAEKNINKIKRALLKNYIKSTKAPGDNEYIQNHINIKNINYISARLNENVDYNGKTVKSDIILVSAEIKYGKTKYHNERIYIDMEGNILLHTNDNKFYIEQKNIYPEINNDFNKFIDKVNNKLN